MLTQWLVISPSANERLCRFSSALDDDVEIFGDPGDVVEGASEATDDDEAYVVGSPNL